MTPGKWLSLIAGVESNPGAGVHNLSLVLECQHQRPSWGYHMIKELKMTKNVITITAKLIT